MGFCSHSSRSQQGPHLTFLLRSRPRPYKTMPVLLGHVVPNFKADTTIGPIDFHEFITAEPGKWVILFSRPADFTPVCTTELSAFQQILPELQKRNVKPIALSVDSVESHKAWAADIVAFGKCSEFTIPIIADVSKEVANAYGMMDPDEMDAQGMPLTARSVFIIGPDKKLKLSILYPATPGRNVSEVLRVIDSLQLTSEKKVATPVNWKLGEDVIVPPSVSQADAAKMFPENKTVELPSGKAYLRYTPTPK